MFKKIKCFFKHFAWQKYLMLSGSICLAINALANPVVDNIAAGNVSIQQSPNTTVVNQTSPNAIINWNSFNIGAQESTHFQQPVGGIALNRISPTQGVSEIYGRLTATGQIILANPAGIYFGPNAYVNVGGLIATTANITDQNFLNGNYIFNQVNGYSGSVINQGTIIAAQHGLVALIGNNVRNDGLIQANLGHVVLASGGAFTLSFANNDLISFSVNAHAGNGGGVSNTGSLIANGGSVLISARAAQNVLDNVINLQGVVQAQSVAAHRGEIIISGDKNAGVVRVASKMNATGKNAGEKGGTVKVTGYNILLDSPTLIDVSGDAGAGDIYIGGNYQGKGPLPNANAVYFDSLAQLKADALTSGNGGNIILWSDYLTKAYGNISAQGGAVSGDGGFIETSSHNILDVGDISVNTKASNGTTGQWLLDPLDLIITNTNSNLSTTNPPPATIFQPSTGPSTSNLSITTLNNALGSSDVIVQTGASGSGSGNISVNNSTTITWSSNHSLTLSAYGSIIFGTNSDISTTGTGNVILRADNTGTGTGTVSFGSNSNVNTNGTVKVYYNPTTFGTQDNIYTGGTTPTKYMLIYRLTDPNSPNPFSTAPGSLTALSQFTNNGDDAELAENYALSRNIDASASQNWAGGFFPIGYRDDISPFTGQFDGQGYVISNLYIKGASYSAKGSNLGLIGYATNTIENVGMLNTNIDGMGTTTSYIGALVAQTEGLVRNSYSDNGTIIGNVATWVGGLVGVGPEIHNAHTSGSVSGVDFTGGLVGEAGLVSNVYSTANVSGHDIVDGIAGEITAADLPNPPPLVGQKLSFAYATGNVSGNSTVGGLVGALYFADIEDAYATGNVSGTTKVGGLLGRLVGGAGGNITRTYAIGNVSGSSSGGLVGSIDGNATFTITNSYWDSAKSGQSTSASTNSSYKSGCFGSTSCANGGTVDLTKATTFTTFDFNNNWGIIEAQSYPFLKAFYTSPRVVAGTSSIGVHNSAVVLADNGTIKQTGNTYNDGSFYFLTANGSLGDNDTLLLYLNDISSNTIVGNIVVKAPTSGGSLSIPAALSFSLNKVVVGSNLASSINNTDLNTAAGSLVSDSDILFSYNVGTAKLSVGNGAHTNIDLNTKSATTYTINGDIEGKGTSSLVFSGPVVVSASNPQLLTNAVTGNVNINSTVTGTGANNLTINTPGTASTITGVISNLAGLIKSGTGKLTLSGINTYLGSTTISDGTLLLDATGTIPSISDVTISSSGKLDLSLSGNNKTIGSLTGPLGSSVVLGAGTLTTNGHNNLSTTFRGIISGNGGLTKEGTGILSLGNANTFAGTTTINNGTVQFVTSGAVLHGSLTGPVNLANSGTVLDINNIDSTVGALSGASGSLIKLGIATLTTGDGNNSTFSGSICDVGGCTGSLKKVGSGNFTLAGNNYYTGLTQITAGTLTLGPGSSIAGPVDMPNAGATLDLNNNTATIGSLNGVSGTFLKLGTGSLTTGNSSNTEFDGIISGNGGSLTKQGSGMFTLGGVNTYTGVTTINAGTLRLQSGSTISGSVNMPNAGATLDLNNNSATIGSLFGATGTFVTLGSGTLTTGGTTSSGFGGTISGTGSLKKQGTGMFTLSGTNTYTGTTQIDNGTLRLQGGSALADGNSVQISQSSATLDISSANSSETIGSLNGTNGGTVALGANTLTTGGNNNTTSFNGTISGTGGGITKKGTGTFTLAGANTYSGATNIQNGVLSLTNLSGLGNSSSINVIPDSGSSAALDINASGVLTNGNTINLTGTGINEGGALTLSANNITLNNAITLADGQTKIGGNGAGTMKFNGTMTGGSTLTIDLPNADVDLADITLSTIGDSLLVKAGGILTLDGVLQADIGSSSGVSIELVTGVKFVNNIGPSAVNPGSGVFLIWSVNPLTDTRNGLTYSFKQYGVTYDDPIVSHPGNGLLYSYTPSVTANLIGPIEKVYDATTTALLTASNYTVTGAIDFDTVNISHPNGNYDDKNVGTGKTVTSDTISILSAHNDPDNADVYGYTLSQPTATYNNGIITAANLAVTNVTADSRGYNGTDTTTLSGGTILPFVGDDVSLNTTNAIGHFVDKNVGNGKSVTATGYTLDGTDAGNYAIQQPTGLTADITPASITVTSDSVVKTYGDDDPTSAKISYHLSAGTLFDTDTLTGDMGRDAGETVGFYDFTRGVNPTNVTVSDGNNGNNYTLTFDGTTNKFQIVPRSITGTVADQTKIYGANDPSLNSIQVNLGNVVNRTVTDINGNATVIDDTNHVSTSVLTIQRASGEDANEAYLISGVSFNPLTGDRANNYDQPGVTGSSYLSIERDTLSATIANQSKVYGSNDPAIAGIPVTLSGVINNPNIYTWNGPASINDTGNVTGALTGLTRVAGENVSQSPYSILTADFALSGSRASNYNSFATFIGQPTLTITPANVAVKANAESKFLGSPDPTLTYSDSGFFQHTVVDWMGNLTHVTGDLRGLLSRVAGEQAGAYPILLGTLSAGSNYNIDYSGALFTIINIYSNINTANINDQPLFNVTDCSPQRIDAPILNSKCLAAYKNDYLNRDIDAMLDSMTQYVNELESKANDQFIRQNF